MRRFEKCLETRPKHIAIIGMGETASWYVKLRVRNQGVSFVPDEVWGINFTSEWLKADKIFLMDGIEELGERGWQDWALRQKQSTVPIITPTKCRGIPCSVRYPIEFVVETVKEWREFYNTAAYMIAYAIAIGVKRIDLFGCDFDYDREDQFIHVKRGDRIEKYSKIGETGKSAMTFWLGIAIGRGIAVNNLFGTLLNSGGGVFYGYPPDGQPRITVSSPSNDALLPVQQSV